MTHISALLKMEGNLIVSNRSPIFISIDGGGTTLDIAAFRSTADTEALRTLSLPSTNEYSHDVKRVIEECTYLSNLYGPITAIGIGLAGKVNAERTSLVAAGNLTSWVGQPLVRALRVGTGCASVYMGGDGEAAALAEFYFGHAANKTTPFLLLIIGTGVGGAWVDCIECEGSYRPLAVATELGHMSSGLSDTLRRCGCGTSDCFECWYSGSGLKARLGIDAKELSDDEVRSEVLPHLVRHLYSLMTSRPVQHVYCTGGVAAGREWLLAEAQRELARMLSIVEAPLEIRLSKFGKSAGIWGGLAMCRHYAGADTLV